MNLIWAGIAVFSITTRGVDSLLGTLLQIDVIHMRKVNLNDVAEKEKQSPKGKFHSIMKNISIALGREAGSLTSQRHPLIWP